MTTFLIFLHVVAAILLLGPVVVSTSMFPRQVAESRAGGEEATGRASVLYRITKTYGMLSLLVPLLGGAVLASDWETYKANYWFHTAIVLSVIAWAILLGMVIPQQRKMMGTLGALPAADADPADQTTNFEKSKAKATAGAGIFNLLWVINAILMVI